MRFGALIHASRGRVLPSGLLLAAEYTALGFERGVTSLAGLPPTTDTYVQVVVSSNAFDKVRTWLQVDERTLVPYLDFQVGASSTDTAQNLAAALALRGYRVTTTGTTIFLRAHAPEEPLRVAAPYNWGPRCLVVSPAEGETVSPPAPPRQEVYAR